MQPFVIVPALWATIVLAWDAGKIDCDDDSLCFTSFVWCASQSGCSYPEGVYPPVADPQDINYALLMENVNHTISWKVPGQDTETPVRVQWELDEGVSWELSKSTQATVGTETTLLEYLVTSIFFYESQRLTLLASTTTDTTERQVTFNPGNIVRSLLQEDSTTNGDVSGAVTTSTNQTHLLDTLYNIYNGKMTIISISQPEAAYLKGDPEYKGGVPEIWSSRFIVTPSLTGRFLDAQRDIGHGEEYKKWRLGVGIGVGLGVPILMVATALGTWILGKRIEGRKHAIAASSKD
ncbi:hypothetical protein PG996_004975 [Apiospora saccharicola]|uniref:Uncharacterized protein n=1 Tax=Apiospora saccharicola TaxID=335842 RepID=A0ABR1VK74_9PEZI